MRFKDREDAGRQLAEALKPIHHAHPVILALARGGVPVGLAVARALHAPLDAVLVRKIGHPQSRELAVGAVAEGTPPVRFFNEALISEFKIAPAYLDDEVAQQEAEIARRGRLYRAGRPRLSAHARSAIVVDDGIATGATVRAALLSVRQQKPARLILAVPVAASDSLAALRPLVDEVICLYPTSEFAAVGCFYDDFHAVEDAEVMACLRAANAQAMRA